MKHKWTNRDLEILKREFPHKEIRELPDILPGKTFNAIKCKAHALGLKKAVRGFVFTPEQLAELIRDYPTTLNRELAERFGCSIRVIQNIAAGLKLKKDSEFLKSVFREKMSDPNHPARKSQFIGGSISKNKGKKQEDFMSPEGIAGSAFTRFRKGDLPHNIREPGYERLYENGYVYTKVAGKRKLVLKHRHVWEQHHGKIPEGYSVRFRDGNSRNCDIENLYINSRSDQLKLQNSGSLNLADNVVAVWIAGGQKKDKQFLERVKANPELIKIKRQQILLNRKIKEKNGNK
jgi:hypothetical protein